MCCTAGLISTDVHIFEVVWDSSYVGNPFSNFLFKFSSLFCFVSLESVRGLLGAFLELLHQLRHQFSLSGHVAALHRGTPHRAQQPMAARGHPTWAALLHRVVRPQQLLHQVPRLPADESALPQGSARGLRSGGASRVRAVPDAVQQLRVHQLQHHHRPRAAEVADNVTSCPAHWKLLPVSWRFLLGTKLTD